MNLENQKFDVCIVGAGVAGASLACFLGQRNIKVALVEKQWEAPDRIVGELLQPDGFKQFEKMNLRHVVENIDAQEVHGYAIFLNGENIKVQYPNQAHLTPVGYGLKNQKLLENLRSEVEQYESVQIIKGNAKSLIYENKKAVGVEIESEAKITQVFASLNVISDGFFSKLRKDLHEKSAVITGYFLGMLLENTPLEYEHYGHVFVNEDAKFLAYPTTSKTIRLLIERKDTLLSVKSPELKMWLNKKIKPQLPLKMHAGFDEAVAKADFKIMPNHLLPADPKKIEGVLLLGDSLNMRNPLTGGGMTVALTDAYNLGKEVFKIQDFEDDEAIENTISNYYEAHKCNATINILADALQMVFSDVQLAKACFDYLKKGGTHSEDPVSLLAGLNRNQTKLLRHFFAVAYEGASEQIKVHGITKGYKNAKDMMVKATKIVSPLLLNENQNAFTKSISKWAKKMHFSLN